MPKIFPGRYTAQTDESFVVFLIGFRINNLLAFNKWIPTARAMNPMLQALYEYPEKGFLSAETFFYWRGIALLQYWRSFDDLDRFARNPSDPHLAAWRAFNQAVGGDGSVGIWHETYQVQPGQYESIYGNMPLFGLAKATNHVKAIGRKETARRRMGGENEPAVPSPVEYSE
jgi:hypothetical protein